MKPLWFVRSRCKAGERVQWFRNKREAWAAFRYAQDRQLGPTSNLEGW